MVDHNGNLWIATLGGGLNKYRVETDDFISYRYNKDDSNSISQDIVMSLLEDKNGNIWIGTADGGLNQFDVERKTFKRFLHNPSDPNSIAFNTIISIATDKQGNLWLGSNQGGVDKYDPRTNIFTHFSYSFNDPNTISSNNVNHIFIDSRNLVYISTDNGLTILDTETCKIKRIYSSPSNNHTLRTSDVHCVLEDKDHNIWVGTYGGLSLLKNKDYSLFEFKNYFNNPVDIYSLSNNLIRCIYQDRSGLIWIGNFSNGVDKFDPNPSKFHSYQNDPEDNASLSNNIVRCFNEDNKGNIWIGTFGGGLNRFDPKSKQFKVFRNDKSDKNTLSLNFINSICIDNENNLWIGTYGGGLNYYDQRSGKFKRYCYDPSSSKCLSNNYIRSMLIDKKGLLWIATSGGGLNQFDPQTQEFTHFIPDNHNPKSISSDRIFCIHEAANHKSLWIGTGNGLNRFNKEDSSFDHFTKENGFPSDVILGILEDKSGFLWISTNDGLCKFDPRSDQCKILKVYDDRDGLNSSEFSEGAFFRDKQENLFFGGVKGFTFFNPLKITDSPLKPITYVVDFKVFNKDVLIDSSSILKKNIVITKEISLNYSDYVFSFEFSALNYNHPEKNQYLYKLDGFDENWVSTTANRRFVTYTNLDPGNYTFMVKASNNDGVWNDISTNIKLIVYPPFWKTWWFRVLVIFIIILCFVGYYRWRIASLRKQKLLLEQIVKEKTARVVIQQEELQAINEELTANNEELFNQRKELEATLISLQSTQKQLIQSEKMALLGSLSAGIAHEINNPLNFIQGGILGIQNYLNDDLPESIEKYNPLIDAINVGIERASVIVASLSNYSRHGELPNTDCDIHSIIESCLVIIQNKIKDRIEVCKEFTEKKIVVFGSEGKLHQAFLNLFANAEQSIADRGTINIVTQIVENYVIVTITDSGCGISPENLPKIFDPFYTTKAPGKGTGLGLSITFNIIQEHNGTIDYESQLGKGTKVIIKLPAKYE